MILRITMVAALVMGSVDLSAQGRRADRSFNSFGLPAADWCREVDRGNRYVASCDVREQTLSRVTLLDVDPGGNGGIHVRGTSGSTTRVRFRVVANAPDEREARELVEAVRVSTDGGRIRASGPDVRDGRWWNVEVEIETPRDTPLALSTRNGGIAIEGVSNRTQGEGLNVETTNGGVHLELPANYNAELHTETNNGGIVIDFPITVRGQLSDLRRRIDTTIGSGGAPLRVRTVNGGVRIARR